MTLCFTNRVKIHEPLGLNKWQPCRDLTELVLKQESNYTSLDQVEACSIKWTGALDSKAWIGIGFKSGQVVLTSMDKVMFSFKAHDSWITAMCFSPWFKHDQGFDGTLLLVNR